MEVDISRALDQELEWFFVYGEAALRRGAVQLVPRAFGAELASTHPNEDAFLTKAHALARRVKASLDALPDRDGAVLRAMYTPRRWPRSVEQEFKSLAPLVVRLALVGEPWPARVPGRGLEDAAALRLSAQLVAGKGVRVANLRGRAETRFRSAVMAYTKVRLLEAPAVAPRQTPVA